MSGHDKGEPSPCKLETNSDGRAEDVRFRTIPTPTPPGGSYVGGMVVKEVSKDCIFNKDFGHAFKSAVGATELPLLRVRVGIDRNRTSPARLSEWSSNSYQPP